MTEKLKSIRALNSLTQEDVAKLLGLSTTCYMLKENQKREFKKNEMIKIKDIFSLSDSEFFEIFFE